MNFKDFSFKLKSIIQGITTQGKMKQVADKAKDLVVERTSKGFGVNEKEGPKTRLKGLSESYKKQRRRFKRQGKLSTETSPRKSNLTKTRKMLDSVSSKATDDTATVFLSTSEASQKAQYQEEAGRKFMNLSKTETKQILKIIEQQIINDIRKKGL